MCSRIRGPRFEPLTSKQLGGPARHLELAPAVFVGAGIDTALGTETWIDEVARTGTMPEESRVIYEADKKISPKTTFDRGSSSYAYRRGIERIFTCYIAPLLLVQETRS